MKNNRIHQRALAFLLSFALLFSIVPMAGISAFAEESSGVTAYYNGSGLFKDSGYTQAISPNYDCEYISTITRIVVKENTKAIGDYACINCNNLTEITIPDSVTSIGKGAFSGCNHLTGITIPVGVTSIEEDTFYDCESLTGITIPAGVTSIGDRAFYGCSSLTGIAIPGNVTSIGNEAFLGCTAMQTITVGPGNTNYSSDGVSLFSQDGTSLIASSAEKTGSYQVPDSVRSIGKGAFAGSKLTDISFGTGSHLTSVEAGAFNDCEHLTELTLPDSVNTIEDSAFQDCKNLKSITLPESLTSIESEVFYNCGSLASVTIPKHVTSIKQNCSAFWGCNSLEAVNVEQGNANYCSSDGVLYTIGTNGNLTLTFCPYAKTGVCTVKASTTDIGYPAFAGCSKLTDITLPEGLTTIRGQAFDNCTGLTRIDLPESVTDADWSLFQGCTGLKAVTVSENLSFWGNNPLFVTAGNLYVVKDAGTDNSPPCENKFYFTKSADGSYRFQSYTGTKVGIVIPTELYGKPISPAIQPGDLAVTPFTAYSDGNSLYSDSACQPGNEIDENRYCEVTNVVIGSGVTQIGGSAFSGCSSLTEITIPDRVTDIDTHAFYGCSALQSITIVSDTPQFCSRGGVLYQKEDSGKLSLYYCPEARTGKLEIPSGVDAIARRALEDCVGLTDVTIPSGVTQIGDDAFEGCTGLTNVTIPSGVTKIGDDAFEGCTGLTDVTIPSGVTQIGYSAFEGCTGLTNVTIPSSVTEIQNDVFAGCAGLKIVVLEGASTTLGNGAFNLGQDERLEAAFAPQANPGNDASNPERNDSPLTVYVPQANLDFYNTAFNSDVLGDTAAEIKAIPVISAFDTPSPQITAPKGAALADLNLPQTLSATVNGAPHTKVDGVTWNADRPYDPNTTGAYSFTAVLPFYCRTAENLSMPKLSVHVVSSSESHSSGTPVQSHPSGATDAATNAQVDLSGATMPSGVTSVTLSVTPETATGAPTTPETTGGTADPQAAAAFHLAISSPSLNIIGTPVLYNLKLLDQNGIPITGFSGKVTVKIPVPAGLHGTPHVFRYEENTGTFTDMNAIVENGFLVFSTEHFSYYTVAGVGNSVALDTKSYQMPVGGNYQIGVKLTGSKAASVKVTSTNGKTASAARLKNGNVQVKAKGTGSAYIMIDVYDSKNHLLTHASVKVDVKTGIRPRGDSTKQIGVF